nr:isochorismatase family protein [Corynebacterium epidermidicanis]
MRDRGITQLFIGGIVAGIGVESTVRGAFDAGFNVVVISDAITDHAVQRLSWSLERSLPMFAEVATTAEIIDAQS